MHKLGKDIAPDKITPKGKKEDARTESFSTAVSRNLYHRNVSQHVPGLSDTRKAALSNKGSVTLDLIICARPNYN